MKKDVDIDPADKHRREKEHILKVLHGTDGANWQAKVEKPNIVLSTVAQSPLRDSHIDLKVVAQISAKKNHVL